MYVISGAVAGVGGALNAISTQVVGLDSLSFTQSAEALVMLVLGGTGSLFGALTGTVIFMLFEDYVSAANPFHWLTMVGAAADRGRSVRAEGPLRYGRRLSSPAAGRCAHEPDLRSHSI